VVTDDFDLEVGNSPIERNISQFKTCVLKERVRYIEAVAAAQSRKTQLFAGGLRKPRFEDIGYLGWKKVYDAFWYMDGSYHCDFLRRQKYNINVPCDVISMKVGGNVHKVQSPGDDTGLVSMDVVEMCNVRNLLQMCLNATTGVEDAEPIPLIAEEKMQVDTIEGYVSDAREDPQDVIVQPRKVVAKEAVSRFEGSLMTRPAGAARILVEQLEVEPCLAFVARFVVGFQNIKDGNERELSVHSVTGEITW